MISLLNFIISIILFALSSYIEMAKQKEKIIDISNKIECNYQENELEDNHPD
ncbi:hypothetical protein [Zunongwangia endophytica]|uniref:Uncharacterized protein n=1 Tax=Zunongwangia endophytica TaxID=1808945 RepID=A0ABV8HAM9_9FLAO|nr:hypothetical protein [Zunongwangia endophytica]MDN3593775.1 hypothetical protein [Zunongwangia endophytica]